MTEGVPEISPVAVSSERPVGRAGVIDQEVTVPPLEVGVAAVIAESFVKVNGLPLYATDDGATSLTTMVIVAVSLPPVFDAVIV